MTLVILLKTTALLLEVKEPQTFLTFSQIFEMKFGRYIFFWSAQVRLNAKRQKINFNN